MGATIHIHTNLPTFGDAFYYAVFSVYNKLRKFVVRNKLKYIVKYYTLIHELKHRREIASISTTHYFSKFGLFRSDLCPCAQNSNLFVMRNKPNSQLLATNTIEATASEHDFLDVQEDLSTLYGFFSHYFKLLPLCNTANEAFVKVSVQYFNVYQSFKFSSLTQFKTAIYGKAN